MPETAQEVLKKEIARSIQAAKTLRDEIKVEVHLAGLDAQDRWKKLEPQIDDLDRFRSEVSETARAAAAKVAKSFQEFRDNLKRHSAQA